MGPVLFSINSTLLQRASASPVCCDGAAFNKCTDPGVHIDAIIGDTCSTCSRCVVEFGGGSRASVFVVSARLIGGAGPRTVSSGRRDAKFELGGGVPPGVGACPGHPTPG